ncbi:MAG: outer membrane lipoprotein carrier protein LolA [Bacteroidota bacterium]|nr:outer membrane lipoprotein carrier protein LolA [Bacteroidota bacterium]
MSRKLLLIISILGLRLSTIAQLDPKAEEILNKLSAKYEAIKSYKASFSYELENPQSKVNEKFKGDIIVKGQKFHISLGNQIIINNGTTVWTLLKEENEVTISDYSPEDDEISPTKIYSIYKNGYKYLWVEEEKSKSGIMDIVDLVPDDKKKPFFKIRLWINKKSNEIVKWRIFEKNGNRYNYVISEFSLNPKIEEGKFDFDKTKYPGVDVQDLRN